MSQSPPTVLLQNATLSYNGKILFNKINLELTTAQWTCLLGASGVGKSTLLRAIAGLICPSANFSGQLIADNGLEILKQVSYMGQADLLLPWLTVLQNVLLGFRLRGERVSARLLDKARDLLTQVKLQHDIHKYPHQLSGGMRQRVALVRTLMEDKPIVLMDEPFSAVDFITRLSLQNLAQVLLQDRTVLFVTHDPIEALRLANQIYIMSGTPATLIKSFELLSVTPRQLSTTEHQQLQNQLMLELEKAYEGEL